MSHYAGKRIAITGAAGGIGQATIKTLAAQGAKLLLIDVDEARLKPLAAACPKSADVKIHASRLDTPAACAAALAAVDGPIHALVHLAGIYVADSFKPEDRAAVYDPVIAANLTSAYDMATAALARFDKTAVSRMVFISSLAYRRGSYGHTAYAAAKGGLAGMIHSLARRLSPGVLVNGIAPGIIDTPMAQPGIQQHGIEALIAEVPLKRVGKPEEIAGVIDFLIGPASTYITGQIINVDGGVVMS